MAKPTANVTTTRKRNRSPSAESESGGGSVTTTQEQHLTTPSSSTTAMASSPHLEWASFIKAHHQRIRDMAKNDFGGDAQAAWEAIKTDKEALETYATSMHHLATIYWEGAASQEEDQDNAGAAPQEGDSEEHVVRGVHHDQQQQPKKYRYDDRVGYALRCIQEYFIGPVTGNGCNMVYLPQVLLMELKSEKRRYHEEHKCAMPEMEQHAWLQSWLTREEPNASSSSIEAIRSFYLSLHPKPSCGDVDNASSSSPSPLPRSLQLLDVGSCYGPFSGKSVHYYRPSLQGAEPQPLDIQLDVVSVDLSPYEDSSVFQCDWLAVPIVPVNVKEGGQQHVVGTSNTASQSLSIVEGTRHVKSILRSSFDIVTFSLLLSYMPTPAMRYEACRQAHAVLRDFGLLIVISTRTQGPRLGPKQSTWIEEWITAIESIGFVRVHKTIQCRLVGLTFQKKPAAQQQQHGQGDATEEEQTKRRIIMSGKMTVTADTL